MRKADVKQRLVVESATAMIGNPKLAAGIKTKLLDLLDKATARQHEGNLEKARLREAKRQREHELKMVQLKAEEPAMSIEQVLEAARQKIAKKGQDQ